MYAPKAGVFLPAKLGPSAPFIAPVMVTRGIEASVQTYYYVPNRRKGPL